ncbi:hypothetical protein CCR75_008997 [Bremia lactucae]|uniref:Uncharacterized protein n=1 Tax=Bremia lactucae TaxID=4779 RepID=A0A976FQW4_BRELC|nr:hypothetical protein CCR75_008997 [Bremia lactucae]
MGAHVHREFLPRIQASQKRASKSTLLKHTKLRHFSIHVDILLPDEVRKLKQKVLKSHPTKLTRFSLTHLRHLATPPVDIPDELHDQHAVIVSGKTVPLTMRMWRDCKSNVQHLDSINESVAYCHLF